jgi:hypothetical protein
MRLLKSHVSFRTEAAPGRAGSLATSSMLSPSEKLTRWPMSVHWVLSAIASTSHASPASSR